MQIKATVVPTGRGTANLVILHNSLPRQLVAVQDEGEVPVEVEHKIFETLLKIRNRDSSIYDSKVQFFEEPSSSGAGEDGQAPVQKSQKPMHLKDVLARQASWYRCPESSTAWVSDCVQNC